nr:MAG TPA: hypothetical protein [Crassvirales sp.]
MKKKNKLYTANKWNKPLFAQGIDREHQNVFDGFFSSTLDTSLSEPGLLSGNSSGLDYQVPQLSKPNVTMPTDWSDGLQSKLAVQNSQNLVNGFGTEAAKNNPFSSFKGSAGNKAAVGQALTGIGLEMTGLIGRSEKNPRGLWDAADPVHYLAGGRESAVGNGLSDAGVGLFKTSAMSGNGLGMLAGAGLKVIGGLTNAAFGVKWNKDTINGIENHTNAMRTNAEGITGATTSDDFLNKTANLSTAALNFSKSDIGKDGWFTHKVGKKYRALKNTQATAQAYANHAITTGAENVDKNLDDSVFTNFAAFGGPLSITDNNNNMGAIDYNFMSDYLTSKNKSAEVKNKIPTNIFGSLASTPLFALGGGIHIKKSHRGLFTKEAKEHGMGVQEFASHVLANKDKYSPEVVKRANFARNVTKFSLGGDMQTNGSDFSNGLMHIDAGGSHESSPYDGVQLGTDAQGKPNLVEEGETIFDDYVFSKRIKADAKTKKKFHIGKSADISYADLSKKLEKESTERPNDAISSAGLEKQMHDLADEQERQKSEMQAKEAQEVFASLPPEQQRAIMQQVAMEEQQAQQQQMEQPTDEVPQQAEQQSVNEQMMQQPVEQPTAEGLQMNACGGKINKYDKGGDMKKKIYNALGLYTDSDFDKWALDQKVDKITDWENILKNKQFMSALRGVNPILSDAISRGYDFGTYVPKANNKLTFDFTHGGWGKEDYDAWDGSTDAAWKEAVNKGLVKKGMNSEEIGKALSQTDAYRRGSDWLKADESNRLNYLQQILNSQDAPQAARDYAAKYVDANGWLKDAKRDYQTIFEDPNGTGVRNTHPGTYWKTPNEILRGKQTGNYVVNDDGSIEEIYGNVPKDWTSAGNYSWQDDKSDYTYNYYKRPTASTDITDNNGDNQEEIVPKHKNEKLRYAGLFGPLVGLGMQAMGIGKPDYSRMDAAVEAASGSPALASYKPIGNYLTYNPMDIWYEQNRMDANSRATDRAILNNASPIGTKMAGLLANGYNSQIADGDLYRKALEYNDAKRQKVAEFNRGTDMYNADAFTKTSATNAEIANRQRQFKAQMQMDAARQRMAADAAWNQGIYGNVSGLFKGISDLGRENAQHNMIANMAADGIFGVMTPKSNTGKRVVTTKKSCGGKIKRKRGLTF